MSASASKSGTSSRGLPIVSTKRSRVPASMARPHLVEVVDVHELGGDPPLGQGVGEQVVGAAVQRLGRDQVVARAGEVEHGQGLGGLPARHRQSRDAAFELRDALLEHVARRVHDAGVDVAEDAQPEQVGGVLRVVEHVARRRVDRHGARVGRRVGRLAGVDRQGVGLVRHGRAPREVGNEKARTALGSGPGLGCRCGRESVFAGSACTRRWLRPPTVGEAEHHSTTHRDLRRPKEHRAQVPVRCGWRKHDAPRRGARGGRSSGALALWFARRTTRQAGGSKWP